MASTRNTVAKTKNPDAHPDPITHSPQSHPVGAGIGAAAGGAAVAVATGAIAGSILGPVGTAVGAIVGGLAGGLIGKEVAEEVNPSDDPSDERPDKVEMRDEARLGTQVARERFENKAARSADISTGRPAIRAVEDVAPAPVHSAQLALSSAEIEITRKMIEEAAYYIHLSGYGGSQDDNWFRAERELYAR